MCCGSKRSAWRSGSVAQRARQTVASSPAPPRVTPSAVPSHEVMLHYTQAAPIRVWGPVTGRPYDFSAAQPVQAIEARDAAVFTRTSAFRRGD
jgi:hypothetical protein